MEGKKRQTKHAKTRSAKTPTKNPTLTISFQQLAACLEVRKLHNISYPQALHNTTQIRYAPHSMPHYLLGALHSYPNTNISWLCWLS